MKQDDDRGTPEPQLETRNDDGGERGGEPARLLDRRRREMDTVSTRIIASKPMEVDGAKFHWWAVGQSPSLVTVRSDVLGSLAEFTMMEPEAFAPKLAKKLLAQHYDRAAELRKAMPGRSAEDGDGRE